MDTSPHELLKSVIKYEVKRERDANTGLEEEEGDLEVRFSLTAAFEVEAATTGREDLRLIK